MTNPIFFLFKPWLYNPGNKKIEKLFVGFSDILITRNEMGENFMCGVNANYSLNSDDTEEALKIQAYNLAGHMTLAFIGTRY